MPSPLSPGGFEDYSVAVATQTTRLYWMSSRDGLALRTGRLGGGENDEVAIQVPKRDGSGTCTREGDDATPWITPDGRRLFFRAYPLGQDCQPLDAGTTDLFVAQIDPTSGFPLSAAAVPLQTLNRVGATDTDPSLSADACSLYFASDRDSTGGTKFKLYRARRR
jgi:hypothetical protein